MSSTTQEKQNNPLFSRFSLRKMDDEIIYYKNKRYYFYALINFFRWVRDPTDSSGPAPKFLHRVAFSTGANRLHKLAHIMRKDPKTREILDKKTDLGKILADRASLKQMPEGSLGREYNNIINGDGDGVSSGYMLGGIIYCDGHFDRLTDWNEDSKYLIVRMNNTHDITHVISGYGTDICGEVLVNTFSLASMGLPRAFVNITSFVLSIGSYIILKPKVGFSKWLAFNKDARERAFTMSKKNKTLDIHYEALLDKPLEEVRETLGIPQHKFPEHIVEYGHFKTKGMLGSKRIAKSISATNPKNVKRSKRLRSAVYLVEKGFGLKETMSASNDNVIKACKTLKSGANEQAVRNILQSA